MGNRVFPRNVCSVWDLVRRKGLGGRECPLVPVAKEKEKWRRERGKRRKEMEGGGIGPVPVLGLVRPSVVVDVVERHYLLVKSFIQQQL